MAEPTPPLVARECLAWHTATKQEVEARLDTRPEGLPLAEAQTRLAKYGPNQLEEPPAPSNLVLLLHQLQSPLIYVLLLALLMSLIVGETVDASVIAVVLVLDTLIGFVQERRAESAVRALMGLVAPRARVMRDGREWEVESRELVPGDLVLLESGTRVPADLRLVATTALRVDESLLTGESLPVDKQASPLRSADHPVAERTNVAYAATVVASGRGRGYVVATGMATELGAIAAHMRAAPEPVTPSQQRMMRLARVLSVAVAVAAVLAFGIGVWTGQPPAQMFLVAVALAVAAIPEGLPVAFTITMAIGVRRMARHNAIVRRLPAVETLGSTTVIGSDKTGTLTENRMTVREIWAGGRALVLSDDAGDGPLRAADGAVILPQAQTPLHLTLLGGVLASEAEVCLTPQGYEGQGDPTEVALLVAAARAGIEPAQARKQYRAEADLPFEPERRYAASLRGYAGKSIVFVKGAPERVLGMCTQLLGDQGPEPLDHEAVSHAVRSMAARGLRVLALAYRPLAEPPASPAAFLEDPHGLLFLGLQGMLDPPRPGVRDAIDGCQRAGIRVLMITGDHAATAHAIGRQLRIAGHEAPVLTGADLEEMDDQALRELVPQVPVYARVAPEQKLRIVQALRERGEVVAVTGDGVNDAPALKAADVGIAMGRSGTDVAREAADIVLADDNFVSIYRAVEQGRITFDNVRKVTFFLLSTNVAEVSVILVALALGWPLVLLPAQILWLNLVTEGLQDVALAFEPGERGVLERPPRARAEGIISSVLWERTLLAGLVLSIGALAMFWSEWQQTASPARAQTVALSTLVMFQAFQVGNARSEHTSVFRQNPLSNPFLFLSTAASLAVHVGALYLPLTQFVLRVEPIGLETWMRIVLVASTIIVAMELHKRWRGPSLLVAPLLLLTACSAGDRPPAPTASAATATARPAAVAATTQPTPTVPSLPLPPTVGLTATLPTADATPEARSLVRPAATPTPLLVDALTDRPLEDLSPEAAAYLATRPEVVGVAVIVPGNDQPTYAIAVLTKKQPSFEAGVETTEGVAARVHADLHPARP